MGELKIVGTAEREVSCDMINIYLKFSSEEKISSKASEKVTQNCENFLKKLQENGVDISKIQLDNIDLKSDRQWDNKKLMSYGNIRVKITLPYDMVFINMINEWIQSVNYEVNINIDFYIADLALIHKELLKEAILDSKKKAEMLAEMMEQKVTGIKTAFISEEGYIEDFYDDEDEEEAAADSFYGASPSPRVAKISDFLQSPKRTETERVTIVWNIE